MKGILIFAWALLSHHEALSGEIRADSVSFSGSIEHGDTLRYTFGDSLVFQLVPIPTGWEIMVRDLRRSEDNIARLTPPLHFVPNPRDIEGWHFRNESNSGPNDGSVNAPQEVREFVFSRRVGVSIETPLTQELFEQIRRDGRGILTITSLELGNLIPGQRANITRMQFQVQLYFSQ